MGETEVSKMVAVGEKCGLDMSSFQDLPNSNCNGTKHHYQANDPDNSYVFVNGADGMPDGAVGGKDVVVEDSQNQKNGAIIMESQFLNEGLNGNGEVKKNSVVDSEEVHIEITESVGDADVEQVGDSNGRIESMSGAEVEKDVDQNGQIQGQQEDFDRVTIAEFPNEAQVGASGLVGEIEEHRESNNILLNGNSSNIPNDGEDQSITEALEAQQRSEVVVVGVDDHELQCVGVRAGYEAESTRELAEVSEHELCKSTSLDLESLSINSKCNTVEEEAKMEFSSNVLEDQQVDTGQDMRGETDEPKSVGLSNDSHVQTTYSVLEEKNEDSSVSEVENGTQYHEESREQHVGRSCDFLMETVGDLVFEEKDEVYEVENGAQYHEESQDQPVGCISDTPVQTTSDLVVEEINEDSSSSEENVAQHHEESHEQPVGSSGDSQVQSTSDLALEVKNEDSSVSVAENGARYPEESQEQPVVSSTDSHLQITHDLVVEEKDEDSAVSEVENGAQYHEESNEQPVVSSTDSHVQITCVLVLEEKAEESSLSESENGSEDCGASHDTTPSETMTEASVPTQRNPASSACAPQSGTEVSDAEEIGRISSHPVVGPESQIIEKVVPVHGSVITCISDETRSGSECALDMVIPEKEIAVEGGDDTHSETEVSSGKSKVRDETIDVKLEPDSHIQGFSARISGEKSDDVAVSCGTDISDSFNLDGSANIELEVDGVKDAGDELNGAAGESKQNLFVQEKENTGHSQNEETCDASEGVSTTNTTDGENKSIKTKMKSFNFLIRTPRFDDENLREQVRLTKLQVDEKTKLRDAIQLQIQEKRANSQINGIDYEFSKGEGRSARKLVRAKRMEIDSLLSVINKAKNALSIEDIDSQIHNMEHIIQHETLPLKEEKQLIREIKQLKQLREQLSSNLGSQEEIKQALEQKEEIEERLKVLRKELDILKNRVLKAEATAAVAETKYDDENRKVKELQAQFRAADEVRQAAYAHWQNLRKELLKKSKYFFKYKDDAAVAGNYAFSRDTESLYRLCTNQVGSFMELWNTNPEFRKDYVKFNVRSNIRRFGTLDCRSLGPDEEPPSKPGSADERSNRTASTPAEVVPAPQISSVELKRKIPGQNVTSDNKSIKKATEFKSQKVPNRPAVNAQVNGLDIHTIGDTSDEVHEDPIKSTEEPIKSREEIDSMRKEEEMRREKAEVKLKEQRRLEALEKANEARERKKRQAEKLQHRAELKLQKEAEQREKEREKRLRKKERKKAGATDGNDINKNCETAPSSESTAENNKEVDAKDVPPTAAKKPWLAAKQCKTKSIPPPLRNRNKKKLQQWVWVGITSFIILVLFWLGNIGIFDNVAFKRRAPVY